MGEDQVMAIPRTPLPITETGYRSHFIDPGDLADYADAADFARFCTAWTMRPRAPDRDCPICARSCLPQISSVPRLQCRSVLG